MRQAICPPVESDKRPATPAAPQAIIAMLPSASTTAKAVDEHKELMALLEPFSGHLSEKQLPNEFWTLE